MPNRFGGNERVRLIPVSAATASRDSVLNHKASEDVAEALSNDEIFPRLKHPDSHDDGVFVDG